MNKKKASRGSLISGALILIAVIGFLGMQAFHLIDFQNWWAILFLIPAISSFGNLLDEFSQKKPISFSFVSALSGILFPTLIAYLLLFNLAWLRYLPVFIIIAGIILFQSGFVQTNDSFGNFARKFRPWLIAGGAAVVITGFLSFRLIVQGETRTIPSSPWWGLPLVIFASGGVFQAFGKNGTLSRSRVSNFFNLLTSFLLFIPALLTILNRRLDPYAALFLLAGGILIIFIVVRKIA